jgi:hypothetical protein
VIKSSHYAVGVLGPFLLLLSGQAPAQGLPVANVGEIVAGAQSCIAATSPSGVDRAKLQANGWHTATISANGKPVQGGGIYYGKGDLLLRLGDGSSKICFVSARIADSGSFGEIGYALDKGLGVAGAAKPGEANTVYWFPADHIVQLQLTGGANAPGVRVAVGYNPAEKK